MDVTGSQYNIEQCHLCFKRHVWAAVFSISGFHALPSNWSSRNLNAACFHILRMRKRLPAKHKLLPQHISSGKRSESKNRSLTASHKCVVRGLFITQCESLKDWHCVLTGTLFILASNTMTRAWKQASVAHNVSPTQMKTIIRERTSAAPPPRQRYLKLWSHVTDVFT